MGRNHSPIYTLPREKRGGKTGFHLSFVALACLLSVPVATAQDTATVFEVLKALYESTDGDNWTNNTGWDTTRVPTSADLVAWHGLSLSGDVLIEITLDDNNLNGTIPSELGNLDSLLIIDLFGNSLNGTIPSELGNLEELQEFYLDENSLSGPVPHELTNLVLLESLYLTDNDLTGSLPTNLTQLTALRFFGYDGNNGLCAPSDPSFQAWLDTAIDPDDSRPICGPLLLSGAIEDQTYTLGLTIDDLVLPEASGGLTPRSYTLSPNPPGGLVFDGSSRTLSGTPTEVVGRTLYTYTVEGASGATVSLTFYIEVESGYSLPSVADQVFVFGEEIPNLVLPEAEGGTGPHSYTLSPDPPQGLDFDASSRALSGTPMEAIAPRSYTYTATDAAGLTVSQTLNIEVKLALEAVADQVYTVGEAVVLEFPIPEGGTDPYDYMLSPVEPAGLEYDSQAHLLSGTPTLGMPATTFTYTATDAAGLTVSRTFEIEVQLALEAIADQEYRVGQEIRRLAFSEALGGTIPLAYTLTPDPPEGLTFDDQALTLTGTPTRAVELTTYEYAAEDATGAVASRTFSIEVFAIQLPTIPDQAYVVGLQIPDLVLPAALGGAEPLRYMLSPDLPAGLEFDAETRTLSGTPMEELPLTTYWYTVTDVAGATAQQPFEIEVVRAELTLPPVPDQVYVVGEAIPDLALPEAFGGTGPYAYTLTPDVLPAGLAFDASTYKLSGTPTEAVAPMDYTYTVMDADEAVVSQTFRIEVKLALQQVADQVYVVETEISPLALPAAAGGTDPYTYSLRPDPPDGLVFDASSRTLSGTPTAAMARAAYTYRVTDAAGLTVSDTFHIEVSMGLDDILDQSYVVGETIPNLVLPPAVGGAVPYAYSLGPSPPEGLVFDASSHTLSGTPTAAMARTAYTYRATDAAGLTVSDTFHIEVSMGLDDILDQSYVVEEAIPDLVLPAAEGGMTPYTYSVSPAPPEGIVFDAEAHTLGGTPTAVTARTLYTYTVTDAAGLTVSATFHIEVVLALTLGSVVDQEYVAGETIAPLGLPAAVGGMEPYVYSLMPDPPEGLVFDASARTLSGTPTKAASPQLYTYKTTDSIGRSASRPFHIEVHLALEAISDQLYVAGEEIPSLVLPAAEGGTGTHSYTLSPDLPQGLNFDAPSRTLSGTPAKATVRRLYTYMAEDASGATGSQLFTVEVSLGLADILDQSYVVGEAIQDLELPAAMGGTEPYMYKIMPDPPEGLVFDAQARTLSGTPTAVMARAAYTYMARDSVGRTASQAFTIETYLTLMWAQVADQVYVVGEEITPLVLPQAVGGRGSYEYTLVPDPPPGLVFDATAHTLSGTPTAEMDTTEFTYTVTDSANSMASQEFSIVVLAALALPRIPDQVFAVGEEITPLVLPAAMGGQGAYMYAFSPTPPAGLAYEPLTRTLSGTPTAVAAQAAYSYTVTDAAGATVSQTFSIAVGASAALIRDRAALIALFEATDGPRWTDNTNWLHPPADVITFTEEELSAWFGVSVSDGRVVGLELPRNNLRGALPEALGDLSGLEQLRLYGNTLDGSIPRELGQLNSLRGLLLHDNALVGAIPVELGNLVNLKQLHLHNNDLNGGIPEALAALSALKQLWLYGNSLEGVIPSELGQLDSLRGLLLQGNALVGAIPPQLGDLEHLEDLWLQGNALEGAIPRELGQLDSLRGLLLHDNQLTGTIPSSLGNLVHLQWLQLQENGLVGTIPRELGQLDSLRGLVLHDNQLTGTIPSSLGNLVHLQWLQLQENALAGTIPPELGRLTQLERLQLSGNVLTGSLPDSLGQLTALEYLYVHNNVLTGGLPASLIQLSALKELFFGGPDQEVCAPLDAAFRSWLASLAAVKGPDCGSIALEFERPVLDQRYVVGQEIVDLAMPLAKRGTAPYSYTLHPALPAGLVFDVQTRTLRGAPSDTVSHAVYTYTAVDGTRSVGRLTFAITVVPSAAEPFVIHGNYPNPFRKATYLELSLAGNAQISLEVFDLLGRRVLRQAARSVQAGVRRLEIDGLEMAPGAYLYRVVVVMDQQTLVQTGRMIRMR